MKDINYQKYFQRKAKRLSWLSGGSAFLTIHEKIYVVKTYRVLPRTSPSELSKVQFLCNTRFLTAQICKQTQFYDFQLSYFSTIKTRSQQTSPPDGFTLQTLPRCYIIFSPGTHFHSSTPVHFPFPTEVSYNTIVSFRFQFFR